MLKTNDHNIKNSHIAREGRECKLCLVYVLIFDIIENISILIDGVFQLLIVLAEEYPMAEWRVHPRLEFGIKVMNKNNNKTSMMKDISVGGCFIDESEEFGLLPMNTRVPLTFEIPGKDEYEDIYIEVDGIVVHHGKGGEGMGINFVMMGSYAANVINEFVKSYL